MVNIERIRSVWSNDRPSARQLSEEAGPSRGRVLVPVDDVDAHYAHALAAGARVLGEPTTYPFGERQYSVIDLGGHRWTFTQTVADIDPATWGGELVNP